MHRRTFIAMLTGATLVGNFMPRASAVQQPETTRQRAGEVAASTNKPNYRVLHLVIKGTKPDKIKNLINQAQEAGFNTLVLALAGEVRFDAFTNSETAAWSKAELMAVVE